MSHWYKTVGISTCTFASQAAAVRFCQEVIQRTGLGPLAANDERLMQEFLCNHPEWDEKTQGQLDHIEVADHHGPWGKPTRGFKLVRQDGSETDISFKTAIVAKGRPWKQDVAIAARIAIKDQITACRIRDAGKPCPVCKTALDTNAHVDHQAPDTFDVLLNRWLCARGLVWDDIKLEDRGTYPVFADKSLEGDWAAFHEKHATLRLVHADENVSRIADLF